MTKRILALISAIALIANLFPFSALAEDYNGEALLNEEVVTAIADQEEIDVLNSSDDTKAQAALQNIEEPEDAEEEVEEVSEKNEEEVLEIIEEKSIPTYEAANADTENADMPLTLRAVLTNKAGDTAGVIAANTDYYLHIYADAASWATAVANKGFLFGQVGFDYNSSVLEVYSSKTALKNANANSIIGKEYSAINSYGEGDVVTYNLSCSSLVATIEPDDGMLDVNTYPTAEQLYLADGMAEIAVIPFRSKADLSGAVSGAVFNSVTFSKFAFGRATYDLAKITAVNTLDWVIDKDAPVVTLPTEPNCISVNVTVTDSASGIDYVSLKVGENTTILQGENGVYAVEQAGTIEAVDKAGNIASVELPASLFGHALTDKSAVPATCTEAGNGAYKECSVCHKLFAVDGVTVLTSIPVVSALGHAYGAPVFSWSQDPETKTWDATATRTCSNDSSHTDTADAYHMDSADTKASTCTKEGEITYTAHFRIDGNEVQDTKIVASIMKPHTPVVDEAVSPTCTVPGLTAGSHCSVCGAVQEPQQTVPATGHTEVTDEAVAPTCTETGLTAGSHCSVCQTVITPQTTVLAKGHTEVTDEAVAATCTETGLNEGKHCSVCQTVITAQTTVQALGHGWDEAAFIWAADYSATATRTCKRDATHKDTVTAAVQMDDSAVTDCTVGGDVIYTATATFADNVTATDTKTRTILPGQHTPLPATKENIQDSTCTQLGSYVEVIKCSVCGNEVSRTNKEIALKAHTLTKTNRVAPTCTAEGTEAYWTCSSCHQMFSDAEGTMVITAVQPIEKIAHTPVTDEAVAPTCTETGLTEGSHCSVCQTVIVSQKTVPAKGHTEVTDEAVPPTCTETGLTEGKHCSVCQAVITAQTTVQALGHDWDEAAFTWAADYTATATRICKHDATHKDTVTATVQMDDSAVTDCTVGGDVIYTATATFADNVTATDTKIRTILPGQHTPLPATKENIQDSTCTQLGSYVEVVNCSVCGNEVSRTNKEIALKAHTLTKTNRVAPTCTAEGTEAYWTCSSCHQMFSDAEGTTVITAVQPIEKIAHTPVTDEAVEPTCTKTGLTEGSHCSVCQTVITPQTTVLAKGHTEVTDEAVAATCTETGLNEGKHCSVCQTVITAQTTVQALGHDWDEAAFTWADYTATATRICKHDVTHKDTVTATVQMDGSAVTDCTVGGEVIYTATATFAGNVTATDTKTRTILPGQHTPLPATKENIQDSTCTQLGSYVEVIKCSVCGKEVSRTNKEIALKAHILTKTDRVAPTCTAEGTEAYWTCSSCHQMFSDAEGTTVITAVQPIEKIAHTPVTDEAVAPTCTETGLTAGSHCSVCQTVITPQTTVPAKGHTEVTDEAVAPTCTATGLTAGKHCSVCQTVIIAQTTVEALGHDWDEGTVTKLATVLAEGVKTYSCKRTGCSETRTEPIQKRTTNITVADSSANSDITVNSDYTSLIAMIPLAEQIVAVDPEAIPTIKVKMSSASPVASDVEKMEAAAPGWTMANYQDIEIEMTLSGPPSPVHNLSNALNLSIKLPDSLRNTNSSVSRVFTVVRLHNGVATKLATSYNGSTHSVSFSSDQYSLYGIGYQDVPVGGSGSSEPNNGGSSEFIICEACGHQTWVPFLEGWQCTHCGHLRGTTGVAPTAAVGKSPKTGDVSHPSVWPILVLFSMAGVGLFIKRKNKVGSR